MALFWSGDRGVGGGGAGCGLLLREWEKGERGRGGEWESGGELNAMGFFSFSFFSFLGE